MTTDNLTCFGCGGKGHIERECPNRQLADGPEDKPMWCGRCDRRTRLIEAGGVADRCQQCHPLAHQHITQFTRCPGCRMLVHVWDTNPCGKHSSRPAESFDSRPGQEEIAAIIAGETKRYADPDEAA